MINDIQLAALATEIFSSMMSSDKAMVIEGSEDEKVTDTAMIQASVDIAYKIWVACASKITYEDTSVFKDEI